MADVEFSRNMGGHEGDDLEQDASMTQSLVTATNIAGALMSLALIAGVGVWGYKLMVRDVTGIPIVRAAEGDMRVRPDDPGGQLAQHQGLAVNEIAEHGEASGPVDQVTLATPAVALADEDQPVVPAGPSSEQTKITPSDIIASASAPASAAATSGIMSDQDEIDALVAQLVGEPEPRVALDGPKVVSARPTPDIATPSSEAVDAEPEPVLAALQQSMRPRLRPASHVLQAQPASYTPPAETAEIDPSAIPSGTRLAQLGAFDSPDVARAEWTRLQKQFGPMLADKSRVIEEAQSGGRTFFRLRAMGFLDLSDTRRFCSAMKAEGVDCIPVQAR